MSVTNKVKVTTVVEYCSLCPYGRTEGPFWDRESAEEVYTVRCAALNGQIVHDFLSWNECALTCKLRNHCFDNIPEECPFETT